MCSILEDGTDRYLMLQFYSPHLLLNLLLSVILYLPEYIMSRK